jgi:hypothetical protein
MQENLHPNTFISSALLRVSALLTVVEYFIQIKFFAKEPFGFDRFFVVAVLLGIAYAIRKGWLWIRWLLLALVVVGVFASIVTLWSVAIQKPKTIEWYLEILQDAIQFAAAILLFIPYNVPENNVIDPIAPVTDFNEP